MLRLLTGLKVQNQIIHFKQITQIHENSLKLIKIAHIFFIMLGGGARQILKNADKG